jgi:phosphate transport system protein
MDRSFDIALNELKKIVLSMGEHVEQAVEIATSALMKRKIEKFAEVHDIELKINEEHIKVDKACLKFLAKQGPVAKDLRFIFSIIKLNADLERMGDQAVNIAYCGKDYLKRPQIDANKFSPPAEIEEMSRIVRQMIRQALDSFVREDLEQARKILVMDDDVDERRNSAFTKMTQNMREHPESLESAMDMILVARNLERLGDHATNVAEEVIFVSTGEDIRHGGKFS